MDLVERIDFCLKQKSLKRAALCEAVNITTTSITDWKRRGTIPAADIMLKIAEYLNVSVEWLVTGKEKEKGAISQEETKVLEYYKQLSQEQKEMVLTLLETQAKKMAAGGDSL